MEHIINNINEEKKILDDNVLSLENLLNTDSKLDINVISHLNDIEDIIKLLNDKIENILQNKDVGISKMALERIKNNQLATETLKPFIPYMLVYNMYLNNKTIKQ